MVGTRVVMTQRGAVGLVLLALWTSAAPAVLAQGTGGASFQTQGPCSPVAVAGRDAQVNVVCGMTPAEVGRAIAAALKQPVQVEAGKGSNCNPQIYARRDAVVSVVCGLQEKDIGEAIKAATEKIQEEFQNFQQKSGLTESAARKILETLGESGVEADQLPDRLAGAVRRYHQLLERLQVYEGDDQEVSRLIRSAKDLIREGEFAGAERTLRITEERQIVVNNIRKEALDRGLVRQAEIISDRAEISLLKFNYREAAAIFQEAANVMPDSAARPKSDLVYAAAQALSDDGSCRLAEPLAKKAFEVREKLLGLGDPATVESANLLAGCMNTIGRSKEAESLLLRVLAGAGPNLPADAPCIVCSILRLGEIAQSQGKIVESENIFKRAFQESREKLGIDHEYTSAIMAALAGSLLDNGKFEESQSLYREVILIRRKNLGPKHPDVGLALKGLSMALYRSGKLKEAEENLREALDILENAFGVGDAKTVSTLSSLGVVIEDDNESIEIFRRVVEIVKNIRGEEDEMIIAPLNNLASALYRKGEFKESELILRKTLEIAEKNFDGDCEPVLVIADSLRNTLDALGRRREADRMAFKGTDCVERNPETNASVIVPKLRELAARLRAAGRPTAARQLENRAAAIARRYMRPPAPR